MRGLGLNYQISRAFILLVFLFTSTLCLAEHFGGAGGFGHVGGVGGVGHVGGVEGVGGIGGVHPYDNGWNNGYHNSNVGNYYPGNGWVAPTYIINGGGDYDDCQSVQQCDSNGNCIQTQDCN
ncbi:hypothetical protein [Legionella shakespearei]|uniref:Uncharacterized protein n=1 Tax=Legionella shakespearei DSM 23087 TaxID=1122169 RepID=A0A0W0ZEB4_9GAMM|nr:hypothetical protein [Legionella shakespearei]KTD67505.1 hypothetical protein Lsha_0036 [Legionella shakespearei DSM 23087]